MDESQLNPLISRHLRPLFGFVLSFSPYSREQAFRISVAAFSKTLSEPGLSSERQFEERLFRHVLSECDGTPATGAPGLSAFGEMHAAQRQSLAMVREALVALPANDKALLLLRDQCHLPFEQIGAVLGMDARHARANCLAAREKLRAGVQQMLSKPTGSGHAM